MKKERVFIKTKLETTRNIIAFIISTGNSLPRKAAKRKKLIPKIINE